MGGCATRGLALRPGRGTNLRDRVGKAVRAFQGVGPMRLNATLMSTAALMSLAAAHPVSAAIIEFPAANSRSFIELFEIDSGRSLCNLTCSLVASPTASVT